MRGGFSIRGVRRAATRLSAPIFPDAFRKALDRVTGGGRETLYVHSGLSNLGHFVGGPSAVASQVLQFCDNLFQPTHSYSYPASAGELAPIFDARTTPSEMGLFAETFRALPGAVRSIHSTHSIAGMGPLAESVCARHYNCDTACGEGTPYSQLVHRGAPALLLGVSFRVYTPFHTAEWESGSPFAYEADEINRLRFLDETGALQERLVRRQNRTVPRFHEAGALLEEKGFVRREPLGRGYLLFVPDMSAVHEILVERLARVPDFLRSCSRAELA